MAMQEQHPHSGDWLREVVFGLNDGLVTTLVFIMAVSAVAHASLVLIALGEVVAGGVSMALGGYLSARTAQDVLAQRIATERYEIAHEPEEERAELRAIYRAKGISGPLLERVVNRLTDDEDRWLRALVSDELGVTDLAQERPWRQGLLVGGSFVVGGLIPTMPFLVGLAHPRIGAYALTTLTALGLGTLKSRYTLQGPLRAGAEFLIIVTVGALAGVVIGTALHSV